MVAMACLCDVCRAVRELAVGYRCSCGALSGCSRGFLVEDVDLEAGVWAELDSSTISQSLFVLAN